MNKKISKKLKTVKIMKKSFLLILSVIIISLSIISCKNGKGKNEATKENERVRNVKVMSIVADTISRDTDYPANLIPNEELYLAPATPGRIMRINAKIGDKVAAGKLLIEMDPTQLNTAELQLMNLEKDMVRLDTLIRYGSVSQQQYDQMKTQLKVTRENIELLRTNVQMKAPFSATVTGKYFENGELFSGAPNTQVGKSAVLILQQTNPIKATISISEKYFPIVKTGMQVKLTTETYPDKEFIGKISLIYPTINTATKTFNVEIQMPNNEELLRPGMYAKVNIEFGKESAILVPSSAVLQQLGTNTRYVFLYENGIAKKIIVKLGKRFDDKVEIVSDEIKTDDSLIVVGHANLDNGSKVKIVED